MRVNVDYVDQEPNETGPSLKFTYFEDTISCEMTLDGSGSVTFRDQKQIRTVSFDWIVCMTSDFEEETN